MKWSHYESRRAWESESWYSSIQMNEHAYIKATIEKGLPYVERYKTHLVVTNTWTDDIQLAEDKIFNSLEEAQYHCDDVIEEIIRNIYKGKWA